MDEEPREELAPDTAELTDSLLQRLGLAGLRGRVEIEFKDGRCLTIWRHLPHSRSELVRFDPVP